MATYTEKGAVERIAQNPDEGVGIAGQAARQACLDYFGDAVVSAMERLFPPADVDPGLIESARGLYQDVYSRILQAGTQEWMRRNGVGR